MKYQETSGRQDRRGFTLLELLVVLGLLGIIFSFGLLFGLEDYRGHVFSAEEQTLTSLLLRARHQAINNYDASAHGVKITVDAFVLFSGVDFVSASDTLLFERNSNIAFSGQDEFVFEQLTGQAPNKNGSVTLSDGAKTSVMTIEYEGRITW